MNLFEVNNDQEKYKFIIEIEAKCRYTDYIELNYITYREVFRCLQRH